MNKVHVEHNSGINNDWYTPPRILDAARNAMGWINLDPASSDVAQTLVKADHYFTEEDDGLTKDWFGSVWLNPPYAKGWVKKFMDKLHHEYIYGEVTQAIALVNNGTETVWFQGAASGCSAICLPKGRIRYLTADLSSSNGPLQGQVLMYFGRDVNSFVRSFADTGACFIVAQAAQQGAK